MISIQILSFFTFLVALPQAISVKNIRTPTTFKSLQIQNADTSNVEWVYHRNNVPFFIFETRALSDSGSRSRFNFIPEPYSPFKPILLHGPTSKPYLYIAPEGVLSTSASSSTQFGMLISSPGKFHLYSMRSGETVGIPLVTPNTRPPFNFYERSRFPDEPIAEFSISTYILNVTEIYAGNRSNINHVLGIIQDMGSSGSRDSYYSQLLLLMAEYGHLSGQEIFDVGKSIGLESPVFKSLPSPVQVILSGSPLRLIYQKTAVENFQMRNANAPHVSPPDYVLPYKMTRSSGIKWAITYGGNHQLYSTASSSQSVLTSTISNSLKFELEIYLNTDLSTICIYMYDRYGRSYALEEISYSGSKQYSFVEKGNSGGPGSANFSVIPYELNVAEMYGGVRVNILKTADYILNNSTEGIDKLRAFEELLREVEKFDHFQGLEVFPLGQIIVERFGIESTAFLMLPRIVRLILSGEEDIINLGYLTKDGTQHFPMKYSWASDQHENIHRYTFSYSIADARRFAITYSKDFQLITNDRILSEVKSSTKAFLFSLYLDESLDAVQILCENGYVLRTGNSEAEFFFQCSTTGPPNGDLFTVVQ